MADAPVSVTAMSFRKSLSVGLVFVSTPLNSTSAPASPVCVAGVSVTVKPACALARPARPPRARRSVRAAFIPLLADGKQRGVGDDIGRAVDTDYGRRVGRAEAVGERERLRQRIGGKIVAIDPPVLAVH